MRSSFPHVIFLTSANYLQMSQNKNLASVRYFVSKAFLKKKKKNHNSLLHVVLEPVQVVLLGQSAWGSV